jgi:hypothetical protein
MNLFEVAKSAAEIIRVPYDSDIIMVNAVAVCSVAGINVSEPVIAKAKEDLAKLAQIFAAVESEVETMEVDAEIVEE